MAKIFDIYLRKKYICRDYYARIVQLEVLIRDKDTDGLKEQIKETLEKFDVRDKKKTIGNKVKNIVGKKIKNGIGSKFKYNSNVSVDIKTL